MIPIFYIKEAGAKGLLPLSPAPQIPADPASASLRTISLDDSEHLLHNHHASVATLRLLFTFAPECRSASLRNRCSPSSEYPQLTPSPCRAWTRFNSVRRSPVLSPQSAELASHRIRKEVTACEALVG